MDIIKCLQKLLPNWRGVVWGNSYEGIKPDISETRPTPTPAELAAVWPEIEAEELPKRLRAEIVNAVQLHMDITAQTRNYDNIHTLSSYADSLDIVFAAEGLAGRRWRDEVWITCRQILNDVQQGLRPMPTVSEVLAELPVIEW